MRLSRVALAVVGSLVSLTALMPSTLKAQDAFKNVPASKAPKIFVSIKGTKSGVFPGDALSGAHKTEIAASSFSFELTSPTDPNTGFTAGKRQYKPLVFTHSIGAASALLFGAEATNETLTTVIFTVVKTVAGGKEENFYTVTLTNARITSLRQYTVDGDPMEEVSLSFQKIVIEVGGKTAMDSWNASM